MRQGSRGREWRHKKQQKMRERRPPPPRRCCCCSLLSSPAGREREEESRNTGYHARATKGRCGVAAACARTTPRSHQKPRDRKATPGRICPL